MSNNFYYQLFLKKLESYVDKSPYFEKAEKMTGVKRIYLAQTSLALVALYLIIGRAAQFVCNLIGFVYPAYKSLIALETTNREDDTKWLTYWVVFAAFSVFEFFSDIVLSWFPLYWLAKVVFLLWCSADTPNNGSSEIYNRLLRPFFLQHKDKIPGSASSSSNGAGSSPSNKNKST